MIKEARRFIEIIEAEMLLDDEENLAKWHVRLAKAWDRLDGLIEIKMYAIEQSKVIPWIGPK